MACESFVEHLVVSLLLTTEVVPEIFPNLNVVGHLAVPVGWGSCLPRLAIFFFFFFEIRKSSHSDHTIPAHESEINGP